MSLIGLTGAHGTGKSTILRGVKAFGVPAFESSLSRAAQTALGWKDLKPAEESEENMWALQEQILASMYDRDTAVLESNTFTLVDRTPADVASYVEVWKMKLERNGVKIDEEHAKDFRARCRAMAAKYTYHIIVPIDEAIPFEAEDHRASLDTRDYHEKAVCQFVISGGLNYIVLLHPDNDIRVKRVTAMVNTLQHTKRSFGFSWGI